MYIYIKLSKNKNLLGVYMKRWEQYRMWRMGSNSLSSTFPLDPFTHFLPSYYLPSSPSLPFLPSPALTTIIPMFPPLPKILLSIYPPFSLSSSPFSLYLPFPAPFLPSSSPFPFPFLPHPPSLPFPTPHSPSPPSILHPLFQLNLSIKYLNFFWIVLKGTVGKV